MTIFKKTIAYFSVTVAIMLPVFFLGPKSALADTYAPGTECSSVTNAYFEPVTVTSPVIKDGTLAFNYPTSTNPSIKVVIETSNCAGQRIKVNVIEEGGINMSVSILNGQEWLIPASNRLEFTVKPTEEWCGSIVGYDCQYRIEAGTGSSTYDSSDYEKVGATKGYVLNYDCNDGQCAGSGSWNLTAKNGILVSTTCKVSESTSFYTTLNSTPLDLRVADDPRLELAVFYDGCAGWTGRITMEEQDGELDPNDDALGGSHIDFIFNPTAVLTRIPLVAGETKCDKDIPNCVVQAKITPYNKTDAGTAFETKYLLKYNCLAISECVENINWHLDENPSNLSEPLAQKTKIGSAVSGNECEITSSSFAPHTTKTGTADYELSQLTTHGWFNEDYRDVANPVTLTIRTKKCAGTSIFLDLFGTTAPDSPSFPATVATLHNRAFVVPTAEMFTIKLIAGEEGCGGALADADCRFNIRTHTISSTTGEVKKTRDSIDDDYGNLNFECDTLCDTSVRWKYAGDTSAKPYPSDPLNTEPPVQLEDSGAGTTSPDCIDATTGKAIDGCYQLYSGLAGVLKGKFSNLNSIGDFINALIALAIGIAGVITVGMIMWDGFTYWRAGKAGEDGALVAVKGRIWKRLLGLLLLFTIYTGLRTINPDLLNLTPRIDTIELLSASKSQLSSTDFTAITGEPLKSPTEYDELAKQVASQTSSDYCALRVIMQNESKGNPNVVGQDENVRDPGIPSRVAFINSGKKYSGTTFSPSNDLITQKGFCNDAAGCSGGVPKPGDTNLGLDWRFTKGIGLTQITFYPSDYNSFKTAGYVPSYANKDTPPSRSFNFSSGKITVTPADMFKPQKNLEVAAKLWKEGMKTCNDDPKGAFYTYICGQCSCNGNFATSQVSTRISQYNQCKKENP